MMQVRGSSVLAFCAVRMHYHTAVQTEATTIFSIDVETKLCIYDSVYCHSIVIRTCTGQLNTSLV